MANDKLSDVERKAFLMALAHADKSINNTVNMRGLGPDSPIEWDSFGAVVQPQAQPGPSMLNRLFSPGVGQAGAAGIAPKKKGMPAWVENLLMLGYK